MGQQGTWTKGHDVEQEEFMAHLWPMRGPRLCTVCHATTDFDPWPRSLRSSSMLCCRASGKCVLMVYC